jgi:hypothetical protein
MRTLIVNAHVVDVVARRIEQPAATTICTVLRSVEHIPVTALVGFDGTVHLHASRQLSTPEEVTALRAFAACTDARLAWHPAVTR